MNKKQIKWNNNDLSIYDFLEEFRTEKNHLKNDLWYCNNCKNNVQVTKKTEIYTSPEYLIIHLKRLNTEKTPIEMNDSMIRFPLEGLDMTNYVINKEGLVNLEQSNKEEEQKSNENKRLLYDCYAVTNMLSKINNNGGIKCTYTPYVKNFKDNQWYEMNDISRIFNICTPHTYLLFYKKRT